MAQKKSSLKAKKKPGSRRIAAKNVATGAKPTTARAKVSPSGVKRAWGGVSAVPAKAAAYGLTSLFEAPGPTMTAAANPGFSWHGGPIVKRPQVFSSFWGQTWAKPANQPRVNRLNQYLKDLLQSKYMNILTQYGVGAGAFIRSTFIANVASVLTDTRIQQIIQSGIDNGVFPEPTAQTNNVLMVFLGEGIGINEAAQRLILCQPAHDTAFGYHSFFTTRAGHPFYYAMIPALDNTCLKRTCPSDAGCSLHLVQTQEQRQTQVASHEFAEMVTDPQLNAWFDATTGAENGDICNGESGTISVAGRTWTVQRMYSKFDDLHSNGAAFCVTEPPNPLPRLSPGPPAAGPTGASSAAQLEAISRLLPLPSTHFDPERRTTSIDEPELREYAERIFRPFSDEHIISDLPAFLREAANILSGKKR